MNIRKANMSDLDELTHLFNEFNEDLLEYYNTNLKRKSTTLIKEEIKKKIIDKTSLFLVVEINDELIGFGSGSILIHEPMVFESVKYGKLYHMWIKHEFRNKKFSSVLKDNLFDFFRTNKCKYVEISVLENNTAKEIYLNWGFKPHFNVMRKEL